MSRPSLKLCPDPELSEFVRELTLAIGAVLREIRLPGNPSPPNNRVDLLSDSLPRRRTGRAIGLSYGNLERIESGSVQPRLRTLATIARGVGSSLPTIVCRAWTRIVPESIGRETSLCAVETIVDGLGPKHELSRSLGESLSAIRGSADPSGVAARAKLSRFYYLQLEKGERNGSLWAFISAAHAAGSSLPALLLRAWTDGHELDPESQKAVDAAHTLLSERRWRNSG